MNTSIWFTKDVDYFEFECLKIPIHDVIACCNQHKTWINYKRVAYSLEEIKRVFTVNDEPCTYGFTPKKYPDISVFLFPKRGLAVSGYCSWKSGSELFRIRCTTNDEKGGYIQEVCVEKDCDCLRIVRVMDDDRWDFYERGVPFSFEDQSIYKKRKIIDRFRMADALSYMQHLGFPLCDEELWVNNESMFIWYDSLEITYKTKN